MAVHVTHKRRGDRAAALAAATLSSNFDSEALLLSKYYLVGLKTSKNDLRKMLLLNNGAVVKDHRLGGSTWSHSPGG